VEPERPPIDPDHRSRLIELGEALYEAEWYREAWVRAVTSRRWRVASVLAALRDGPRAMRVAARAPVHPDASSTPRPAARPPAGTPTAVIVDKVQPRPDSTTAEVRTIEHARTLLALGYHVVLASVDARRREPWSTDLEVEGIEVQPGLAALERALAGRSDDVRVVLLVFPDVAAAARTLVRDRLPRARVLYDSVDLHFLRRDRQRAVEGSSSAHEAEEERSELAAMTDSDVTIVVSDVEATVVRRRLPRADVRVVPVAYALRPDPVPPPGGRAGLIFVGHYQHAPNVDAARWLLDEVMPRIWADRPVPVTIAGPEPPADLVARAGALVIVPGRIADLAGALDASRAFIAPLRYGAGVKGKIVQALTHGLPVVTTTIGVEGTAIQAGVHALVDDDPERLAAHALALLDDDALWTRISDAGLRLVAADHATERQRAALASIVGPPERR
jgi:glycosyltransferase involved in cell wall biosynthesis